jgi:enamine deaminase RidA (YjgF/YER057c/UK114 family)
MKREIAERIVAAIKDFDQAFGQLDVALSEIENEEERRSMLRVLLGMHNTGYSHITLPITRQFPDLYPYSDRPLWVMERFTPKLAVSRMAPGPRLSEATIHDERVYLSGVVAEDTSQDIVDQARQALARVQALLEKVGSGRLQILSVLIFLADMNDLAVVNAVWDDWVIGDESPARTVVQAKLSDPNAKIEIMVVAAL